MMQQQEDFDSITGFEGKLFQALMFKKLRFSITAVHF